VIEMFNNFRPTCCNAAIDAVQYIAAAQHCQVLTSARRGKFGNHDIPTLGAGLGKDRESSLQ
jgi:hypothetical protein